MGMVWIASACWVQTAKSRKEGIRLQCADVAERQSDNGRCYIRRGTEWNGMKERHRDGGMAEAISILGEGTLQRRQSMPLLSLIQYVSCGMRVVLSTLPGRRNMQEKMVGGAQGEATLHKVCVSPLEVSPCRATSRSAAHRRAVRMRVRLHRGMIAHDWVIHSPPSSWTRRARTIWCSSPCIATPSYALRRGVGGSELSP